MKFKSWVTSDAQGTKALRCLSPRGAGSAGTRPAAAIPHCQPLTERATPGPADGAASRLQHAAPQRGRTPGSLPRPTGEEEGGRRVAGRRGRGAGRDRRPSGGLGAGAGGAQVQGPPARSGGDATAAGLPRGPMRPAARSGAARGGMRSLRG